MKEQIIEFFNSIGYKFTENGELDLEEIDSVQFISMIIELEETFEIEIPDEYLLMEFYQSLESIQNVIMIARGKNGNQDC